MADEPKLIRDTDEDARRLARRLVRGARFGALAAIEPGTGHPVASRVLTGTDIDGVPVILVSRLAIHTQALEGDPRASLLLGEPGKGDPLAHPRITLKCRAERIAPEAPERAHIRDRFLRRHPKAALYADFPDFSFFRLEILSGSLNGGFGRAYHLSPADLLISSPASETLSAIEAGAIAHMNEDHAEAAGLYAAAFAGAARDERWTITGIDAAGIDLASGDRLIRVDFPEILQNPEDLRALLAELLRQAREF